MDRESFDRWVCENLDCDCYWDDGRVHCSFHADIKKRARKFADLPD